MNNLHINDRGCFKKDQWTLYFYLLVNYYSAIQINAFRIIFLIKDDASALLPLSSGLAM